MTELRRVYWHKRLAGALVSLHPQDLESLAYHYTAAGQREQAIEYSLRSAQRAESVYAYDQARQHLDRALALGGEDEWREQRITLLEELADICERSGERAAAVTALQQTLALWAKLDGRDKIEAVRLHRKLVASTNGMYLVSDLERFRPIAQESVAAGLATLQELAPQPEMVAFLTACSKYISLPAFAPDWEAAERYARAAVQMGEQLSSPVELSAALEAFSRAQEARGLLRERVEVARRQLALAGTPRFGDPRERARTLKQLGDALAQVGEYNEALDYLEQAGDVCREIQCIEELVFVMELQAYCRFQLDQWEEVLAIEQSLEKLAQTTQGYGERYGPKCFHLAIDACVHALRGETEIAQRLHDQSCAIMVATAGPRDQWCAPQHY
jgi:tetratricopeptide (TPR) repeat protein